MSNRLIAYQAFAEVAATSSFSKAAVRLSLSTSQISRLISGLENRMGALLLERTTRTVSLTDAGRIFFMQVTSALDRLAEAEASLRGEPSELSGRLRVSAPTVLGTSVIATASAAFMTQYPRLSVVLVLAVRAIDPMAEGYDVSVGVGDSVGTGSVMALGQLAMGLYASPAYLARHGRPRAPDEIMAHRLVHFEPGGRPDRPLRLRDGYGERDFRIDPILFTNNAEAAKTATLAGQGISQLPVFFAAEDVAGGRLVSLLDGFDPKPLVVAAGQPAGRGQSPAAARYLAALSAALKRLPT